MDADLELVSPAEAHWAAHQRKWMNGWRRYVLPVIFLVYLIYVVDAVAQFSRGSHAVAGYIILGAFALCYLLGFPGVRHIASWQFWALYGLMVALFVAELPFGRAETFLMCVYLTGLAVVRLGGRSVPIVVAFTLSAIFVPVAVSAWHDHLDTSLSNAIAIAIPVAALLTFGVDNVMKGNRALTEARAELVRLTAENERSRIARDLHDLLGHSLTTITVKAGLARRLGATDPTRALEEISEVEALARQSLADVRAAVSNYREVTLLGELANGRELLRSAGVAADLPRAVDVVDPEHHELFGWVVREGLTNVVRHAHAHSCAIRLSASCVEIIDDGIGGTAAPGNGLSGLRERVAAGGGVIEAGPVDPSGWRLRVFVAQENSS